MSYKLAFLEPARKEWDKLAHSTREQFKKKLEERLENPHVPASKLFGSRNRYKIKLRSVGYRLVYEVRDEVLIVVVIAVGKRDKSSVYRAAEQR
jgi:mRNA interferase RelE/StbE